MILIENTTFYSKAKSALDEYVANGVTSNSISDIDISCMSHLVAFAAEEARVTGKVIDMEEYVKSLEI